MRRLSRGLLLAATVLTAAAAAAQPGADVPLALRADAASLKWGACPPVFPGACEIAVVRGHPAKANADVMLRVGPGYELQRHRHTSAERMVLLHGEMRVKYDGADAVALRPSSYAYGPAGLPHAATCVSKTPCTLFIAFESAVDAEAVTPAAR